MTDPGQSNLRSPSASGQRESRDQPNTRPVASSVSIARHRVTRLVLGRGLHFSAVRVVAFCG
jgi:hypothetical protein